MQEPTAELAVVDGVTVSLGLAPVTDGDAVLMAGRAVLEAKRAGRSRLVAAGEVP